MSKRAETIDIFGGKIAGLGAIETQRQPSSKAGQYYRKTYLLTTELIQQIKDVAKTNKVGQSELVRWALQTVLTELEQHEREIPIMVEEKRVINTH